MGHHLYHRGGSLLSHVVDGVLVSQPVGALHGVVEVPPPVVLLHVSQRGVDPALHTPHTIFHQAARGTSAGLLQHAPAKGRYQKPVPYLSPPWVCLDTSDELFLSSTGLQAHKPRETSSMGLLHWPPLPQVEVSCPPGPAPQHCPLFLSFTHNLDPAGPGSSQPYDHRADPAGNMTG